MHQQLSLTIFFFISYFYFIWNITDQLIHKKKKTTLGLSSQVLYVFMFHRYDSTNWHKDRQTQSHLQVQGWMPHADIREYELSTQEDPSCLASCGNNAKNWASVLPHILQSHSLSSFAVGISFAILRFQPWSETEYTWRTIFGMKKQRDSAAGESTAYYANNCANWISVALFTLWHWDKMGLKSKKVVHLQDFVIMCRILFEFTHHLQFRTNKGLNANLPSGFPVKEILIQTHKDSCKRGQLGWCS